MKLYVMRHGPAGNHGDVMDDSLRPLTSEGVSETASAARGLKCLNLGAVAILTSPLARAVQTAELVAAELTPGHPPAVRDRLASGAHPGEILHALKGVTGDALICGHDPDLSEFVGYALGGDTASFIDFSKAGVVAIEFDGRPERAAGRLLWYLRRGQLARIAGN